MTTVKGRHRHLDAPQAHLPGAATSPARPGADADVRTLLAQFPARPRATTWALTQQPRDRVVQHLLSPPFLTASRATQDARGKGLRRLLDWLADCPGDTWQERWTASGAEDLGNTAWRDLPMSWIRSRGIGFSDASYLHLGGALRLLICTDVIRPSMTWLTVPVATRGLSSEMARVRDREGFAALDRLSGAGLQRSGTEPNVSTRFQTLARIATIMAVKGGTVRDITVGDCMELVVHLSENGLGNGHARNSLRFYQLLHALGCFPAQAPATVRVFRTRGQQSVEQLIDRYDISCRPVRDLLVDYLRERQVGIDHATLRGLAYQLGYLFWKDLERHHPGIDDLRLTPQTASAWKQRIAVLSTGSGTRQRAGALNCMTVVRAFYLDIAHWATEDPARWGPWAVPCPIRMQEASHSKERARRKSRMDQRTRELMPVLPALVATVEKARRDSAERLAAAQASAPDQEFTAGGRRLRRAVMTRNAGARIWADDLDTGRRHDLVLEEHRGFWTWAAVEILRNTGIRIEELTEISHHSFVQYRLPSTGELIPLLHIIPSKSDAERLLVISPDLADVLSAVLHRIRDDGGAVPLVIAYDKQERIWNPPRPILFQRRLRLENRPIGDDAIRTLLKDALADSGITDASGRPVVFAPHDLRRIFVTDAVMNGMPPHIAQLVCGHKNINTTMGYKAVYPEEAINGHRAFITRRRALRPSEEYRLPTDEEWQEFLGHFERRKVALGDCGRAYATPCIHEHSCLRCPLLRPDPAQRPRLTEVLANLGDRIAEAEHRGWLGELEGLKVSLAGARVKLAQMDALATRRATAVQLAPPRFPRGTADAGPDANGSSS